MVPNARKCLQLASTFEIFPEECPQPPSIAVPPPKSASQPPNTECKKIPILGPTRLGVGLGGGGGAETYLYAANTPDITVFAYKCSFN